MTIAKTAGFTFLILIMLAASAIRASDKPATDKDSTSLKTQQYELSIPWPKNENWKSGYKMDDKKAYREVFYPGRDAEYAEKESVIVEILDSPAMGGIVGNARMTFLKMNRSCPGSKWKIIERGDAKDEFASLIFSMMCPGNDKTGQPYEDQLWKIISSDQKSYYIQYIFQGGDAPEDRREQIVDLFENIKLVPVKK